MVAQDMDTLSMSSYASTVLASGQKKAKQSRKKRTVLPSKVDEERKPSFAASQIPAGLSQLGKTADGLRPAYLQLEVSGTDMSDASALVSYSDLQTLLLTHNELRDLSHLSCLPSLTHLDVSHNQLDQVLAFRLPPGTPSNLRVANYASNRLSALADISHFSRLTHLMLDNNQLETTKGLGAAPMLSTLSLANNRLRWLTGLDCLTRLRVLNLTSNRLRRLSEVSSLVGLEVLQAAHNALDSLAPLAPLHCLLEVDVSHNQLASLSSVSACAAASLLVSMDLRGNPLERLMSCRLHLVHMLPQVALLNGQPVAPKDKVRAGIMHGSDAEALRTIRRRHFPAGELDDGGGALPPASAGLVASYAEEEVANPDGVTSDLARLDNWARSIPRPAVAAPLPSVRPSSPSTGAASRPSSRARTVSHASPDRVQASEPSEPTSPRLTPLHLRSASASPPASPPDAVAAAAAAIAASTAAVQQLAAQLAAACSPAADSTSAPAAAAAAAAATRREGAGCGGGGVLTQGSQAAPRHLQLARVCFQWVAGHIQPPSTTSLLASVHEPLFGSGQEAAAQEALLLGPVTGMWSERAAWLFVQLAKACDLEAVLIPGYWKGAGTVPPGDCLAAHNHCWAGVKVCGRWRLVDPSWSALQRAQAADTPVAPFFTPPEAWLHSYLPLEAHWQLLPEPVSLADWWQLPHLSVGFFARGLAVIAPNSLAAVNTLAPPREGQLLPSFELCLAAPQLPGTRLVQLLRDAGTREVLAVWPPEQPPVELALAPSGMQGSAAAGGGGGGGGGVGGPSLRAFQQVEAGTSSARVVQFGAVTWRSVQHRLVTALPGPGAYLVEVLLASQVPGGMAVHLAGLPRPLQLQLVEEEVVLSVKVVVPEVEAHEPEDGLLHSSATPLRPLPATCPEFVRRGVQLVSPPPTTALEADRTYAFEVLASDTTHLAVCLTSGEILVHLTALGPTPPPTPPTVPLHPSPLIRPDLARSDARHGVRASSPTSRPGSQSMMGRASAPGPSPGPDLQPHPARSSAAMGPAASRDSASVVPAANGAVTPTPTVTPAPNGGPRVMFRGQVTAPRAPCVQLCALVPQPELGVCGWTVLATLQVAQQSQHIVPLDTEVEVPHVSLDDPEAVQAADLFRAMDLDKDGKVTRRELATAIRRNRQIADLLRLPNTIRAGDASLDRFIEGFQRLDGSKLGTFTFDELCAYMGVKPSEADDEDGSGSDSDGLEEEEGAGIAGWGSRSATPVQAGV